ncbi:hypothetical protein Poli38472_009839 [Pythium oligandrum]|uniref:Myosin motor domain-containing protein n=1 Tax=Pythium oligandrum TaxID=41045 RepID=A0A8K1CF80_PYTOL|nr:hypothetical protein Poli38472_009839 [Pythium oligandrum]|eukprot:TMW62346.1 hypothetical protein Poli38472_009839 [Pythium oligandrum]
MAPNTTESTARARGQSAALGLSIGTRCYIPDKERIWLPVTVEQVNPQEQTATFVVDPEANDGSEDEKSIELSLAGQVHFPLQNAPARTPGGYEDMIDLNHLHEAAILYNLKRRFLARLPYTYTGTICLAVNPYQWIDELYSHGLHAKYLAARSQKQLPPHVYAVSVAAFKHMSGEALNQSILVSGESGAGKTETTKILMDNLAQIGVSSSADAEQTTIQRILDVNPLLESFGNAKTKRNDNSSRFGKFTQLQFHRKGQNMVLTGAKCETYLLEKTRVVTQEAGERNYHVFYQIFHGSSAAEKGEWGFLADEPITNYTYIADDDANMSAKDQRNFERTKHALSLLGLSSEEQNALFRVLAGVLHLGQVVFEPNPDNDEASHVTESSVMVAADLLGLDTTEMNKALCNRTMKAMKEVYSVPLTVQQAASSRDALAKAIYANVFSWMVDTINQSLSAAEEYVDNAIGVLDIFGFESFVHNSFEQLCINYANEKLQQKFTQDVFKAVQEEYQEENITWDHISYADNSDVLALIEGKMGIIALLNEEIVRPKGNDEGFVGKLNTAFRQEKKIIDFPRISRTQFSIHHYAASVKYEAIGFLEKHKDALLPDLSELMRGSTADFVTRLFEKKEEPEEPASPAPGRARRNNAASADSQTVGTQFKMSLNSLMENIQKTNTHYIRCIKPNSEKSTTKIDEDMVVNQLRCAGVIEAICIARAGYPNRMRHKEFVTEFDIFLSEEERNLEGDELRLCGLLAERFKLKTPEEYQMGKTKIYMQYGILERIETLKAEKLFAYVAAIQAQWRGLQQRRRYRVMYAALLLMQRRSRGFVAVVRLARAKASIQVMQRVWRGHVGRCVFHARLCDVRARLIQRVYRGHVGRRIFHEHLCQKRALQIQCAWRVHKACKTLMQLRNIFEQEQARLRAIKREEERLRRIAEAEEARRLKEQKEREERARRKQAAISMQRIARGILARRVFAMMKEQARREQEAAVCLQSGARGLLARRHFAMLKEQQRREQNAAICIQSIARVLLARRELAMLKDHERQKHKAAVYLQSFARGMLARREYAMLKGDQKREQAAIYLQSFARGLFARREFAMLKEEQQREREFHAAICLQTIVRGLLARRRLAQLKDQKQRECEAAVYLQSFARGLIARREYAMLKNDQRRERELQAAVCLQSVARGMLGRRYFATLKDQQRQECEAAINLQRVARGMFGRRQYNELKEQKRQEQEYSAAVCLQGLARCVLARRELAVLKGQKNEFNAASRLQSIVRGAMARRRYVTLRKNALAIIMKREAEQAAKLKAVTEENDRLKQQLQELLEANIELETLVSEWKCEQEVIKASSLVQETELKRQINTQKQKLSSVQQEYGTLCSYLDQNGMGDANHNNSSHYSERDTVDSDSDRSSVSSGGGPYDSPFQEDRLSRDVSGMIESFSSSRGPTTKSKLRAGVTQMSVGKWMNGPRSSKSARTPTPTNSSKSPNMSIVEDPTVTESARRRMFKW